VSENPNVALLDATVEFCAGPDVIDGAGGASRSIV
jgi:hypothetical protein